MVEEEGVLVVAVEADADSGADLEVVIVADLEADEGEVEDGVAAAVDEARPVVELALVVPSSSGVPRQLSDPLIGSSKGQVFISNKTYCEFAARISLCIYFHLSRLF